MPIVKQKKVTLYALKQDRDAIMEALQRYGKMHIESAEQEGSEKKAHGTSDISKEYNKVEWAIRELKQFDERKSAMLAPKDTVSYSQLEKIYQNRKIHIDAVDALRALEDERVQQSSKRIRLDNVIENISPWLGLDIEVQTIVDSEDCVISAGIVPTTEFEGFMSEIADASNAHVEKILTDKDATYVFMVYHIDESELMIPLLSRVGYSPANFQNFTGTPRTIIADAQKDILKLEEKEKEIIENKQVYSKNLDALEELLDAMMIVKGRRDKQEGSSKTEYVFAIEGYIPTHLEDELRDIIEKAAGDRADITIEEPADDDDVPTLYENRAFVRPFEAISDMFGKSRHTALDPNVTMAPFFAIFFGMMMSDAGYGLIIAVLASFIYYKTKPKHGEGNKLIRVIAISGVFTIFWGILYGGYMGFALPKYTLLFNPMQEPMLTLGLCLLMGVIHILVGMSVRAATLIRRGQVMEAVSQQFTWIFFIAGVVMFALPTLAGFVDQEPSVLFLALNKVGTVMLFAGLAGIIILGGHGKKGIGRIVGGLSSLTEITSYLSDILSYSRLFGLGLATGVIGMVVNTMAGMLTGSVFGWIFAGILFVAVHLFNIAINALGAYVHSSRLQYVEYFGKFFEDGGRDFKPFKVTSKYHEVLPTLPNENGK